MNHDHDQARNIQDLTESEINHILQESAGNCYSIVARKHDIGIFTVKRIVRKNRRYG